MASELSQLIDEELEKVERQQSDAEGKARQRKSFQIKGAELAQRQPSWRELAWWTRNRLIAAAVVALLLLITIWLVSAKPSNTSTAGYLSSSSREAQNDQGRSSAPSADQTVADILSAAPSFGNISGGINQGFGDGPTTGLAPEVLQEIAPGPVAPVEAPAIVFLTPGEAPETATILAPSSELPDAPTPAPLSLDGNLTEVAAKGGPVKFQLGVKPVGRRMLHA